MRELFPEIEPYNKGFLDVGSGHKIYFEESGNKNGIPVIKIHGGPGSNSKPRHRQLYNPEKYRIICFDQRGCGQSKFEDLLLDNTTQDLIKDIEKLRMFLGIDKWVVEGGSWGSLLALVYAFEYRENIIALFVSSIFLGKSDDLFSYQNGANQVFPEEHEKLLNYFSATSENILEKVNEQIFQNDFEKAYLAAKEIFKYDFSLMNLVHIEPEEELITDEIKKRTLDSGKIYLHYSKNKYFIPDGFILENAKKLVNLQTTILQGKYDMVCPYRNAYLLSKELPQAEFITIISGHHYNEPENIDVMLQVIETIADRLNTSKS